MATDFNEFLWESFGPELRAQIIAGKHDEDLPNLRRHDLEVMCERARQTAYTEALCGVRVVINKFTDEPEEAWLVWH